jgi:peptidoglycan hydrolase-like protein with peptidoglycan-binding domain
MKKYIIFALVTITLSVAIASAQNYTFSNNLTVGSSGTDVANLQSWLISNGYDIPAVSSGAAAKGYFGSQTKMALINFQRAISFPAFGFFGPMTRERLNGGGNNNQNSSLRVTSPNGGETWQTGTTQYITWTNLQSAYNQTGDIKLEFAVPACAQPGQPVQCMIAVRAPLTIATNVNLDSGSYAWYLGYPGLTCIPENMASCNIPSGQYKIQICPTNTDNSNLQCDDSDNYFTITSGTTNSQTPVINGVDAPTSLIINQTGTWTVHATDPQNGMLSYSVDWGDQYLNVPQGYAAAVAPQYTQSTTFSHSYSNAGTYTVKFMIRNSVGLTAQTSSTVTVTNSNNQAGPLKITSPNGGEVWQKGTTQNITWTSPYYFRATTADLKIMQNYVCTTQVCPAIAYAPWTIATNIPINQNSYSWNVGSVMTYIPNASAGTYPVPSSPVVSAGQYTVQICETGTSNCDSSDTPFTIASASVLLRGCPSLEIYNQMPSVSAAQNQPAEYYIFDGQRHELAEFDQTWIQANCTVPTQTAY